MDEPQSKRRSTRKSVGQWKYTLVQSDDGTYYLVSADPNTPTIPIQNQHHDGLVDKLIDLNTQLSKYLQKHERQLGTGSGVHTGTPDVFPK
jgi:hypothetical protein